MRECYVCKRMVAEHISAQTFECEYCGKYKITDEVISFKIITKYFKDIHRLQAAIFRKTTLGEITTLTTLSIPELINNTIRKPPLETIDNILEYFSQKADSITDWIRISEKDIPRFILKDKEEMATYINEIRKLGYWEIAPRITPLKQSNAAQPMYWEAEVKPTLEGWKKIGDLRKIKNDSNQAFVAMWFDKSMDQIYKDGIKPSLERTGFNPIIMVKDIQHNEKIDDLILSSIRKSRLVVADCTGDRSAVYFEVGFAKGLGIDVIWLRKDSGEDKDKLCFDTRQYNHIFWKDAADLKEQLINRIAATIPGHLPK